MSPKNQGRIFILVAALTLVAGFTSATQPRRLSEEHAAKVREASEQSVKAAKVFDAIMQVPDKSIPVDLLAHAKAIAVFPEVIKAALLVGGEGGRGVVSRRTSSNWSDPVFFRAAGGSLGPQIGVSATDFVLLFMNDDAISWLMKDQFELGTEAGIAAGPVGRGAGAGTDVLMHAEMLSYSRSRGLFAGMNLKGIVVRPEDDLNQAVYGRSAREVLSNDTRSAAKTGAGLPAFPQAIARYAPASSTNR